MKNINQYHIDPVAWAKFDSGLQRAINQARGNANIEWAVMITIAPMDVPTATPSEPPAKQEDRVRLAAERQAAFEREMANLVGELKELGAKDIQLFWINRTISARMTLPALEAAGKREEVIKIMLLVKQKVIATPKE